MSCAPRSRVRLTSARALSSALLFGLALAACKEAKGPPKQLYFKELIPPVGVHVEVLDDVSVNTPAGGKVSIIAVVDADLDRDDLDHLMEAFYRQVTSRRRGFRAGKARQIEIHVYDSKEKAAMRADNWLARVDLTPPDAEASFSNRQRVPLLRWVREALGKQPQYVGALKPQILVDPEEFSVEITIPFVKYDGSGQPVDKLTYMRATTEFSSTAIELFGKIEQLKRLTFVGMHEEQRAIMVKLTRDQFRQVNLRQVEESLGEYRGQLINMKLAGKVSDAKMERMLAKRRKRLYKDVFALLPAESAKISRRLR